MILEIGKIEKDFSGSAQSYAESLWLLRRQSFLDHLDQPRLLISIQTLDFSASTMNNQKINNALTLKSDTAVKKNISVKIENQVISQTSLFRSLHR